MMDILKAIGNILNNRSDNDYNSTFDTIYNIKSTINRELSQMNSVDKMLKIFAGSHYEEDPIKRTKKVANGDYDRYAEGWDLFGKYKQMCNLLVTKFGL